MAYVRTGGMSTASRRRRRTTALVLTSLTVVLLLVLIYAVAYFQGWVGGNDGEGTMDSSQVSATASPAGVEPGDIQVNVYNANGEPGLARTVANELEARDFVIDLVSNDPERAQIDGPADIRFGPDGTDAAEFVQAQVPGSELVPLERGGDAVDLVLGDDFAGLAEPDEDQATATS